MYMQLANFRPDVALRIELAPYRDAQAVATTGLFLCSGDTGTMSLPGKWWHEMTPVGWKWLVSRLSPRKEHPKVETWTNDCRIVFAVFFIALTTSLQHTFRKQIRFLHEYPKLWKEINPLKPLQNKVW